MLKRVKVNDSPQIVCLEKLIFWGGGEFDSPMYRDK